eukprot:1159711-Pelagomonas_calceolata.AAC.1
MLDENVSPAADQPDPRAAPICFSQAAVTHKHRMASLYRRNFGLFKTYHKLDNPEVAAPEFV